MTRDRPAAATDRGRTVVGTRARADHRGVFGRRGLVGIGAAMALLCATAIGVVEVLASIAAIQDDDDEVDDETAH